MANISFPHHDDKNNYRRSDSLDSIIKDEAESVRTAEIPLLASDGAFTTKDCIMKFDLKYDTEYCGTYRINLSVVIDDATKDELDNEIGYLEGEIIKRPHPMFYAVAESISTEMKELALKFCDSRGIANRVKHPKLRYDDLVVNSGGFFHIDTIEVRNERRTQDLSLKMIHETFAFLGEDWNLAVMKPTPLNYRWQRWKSSLDPHRLHDENNANEDDMDSYKLQQHFSRMGFLQSGRNPDLFDSFFITKTYQVPIEHWVNKKEIKKMPLYVPPKKHMPTELDLELQNLIENAPSNETVFKSMMNIMAKEQPGSDEQSAAHLIAEAVHRNNPEEMTSMRNLFGRASGLKDTIRDIKLLIDKGASMDGARALNIAVLNCERCGTGILDSLIYFGADVNAQDEHGNAPLHYAAQSMISSGIETLLRSGADPNMKNLSGEKPIQLFEKKVQSLNDTNKSTGVRTSRQDLIQWQQMRRLLET